jgi:hypothetical protein
MGKFITKKRRFDVEGDIHCQLWSKNVKMATYYLMLLKMASSPPPSLPPRQLTEMCNGNLPFLSHSLRIGHTDSKKTKRGGRYGCVRGNELCVSVPNVCHLPDPPLFSLEPIF